MKTTKWLLTSALIASSVFSAQVAASDLVGKAQQASQQEAKQDRAREAEFKQTEQALKAQKAKLAAERSRLQKEADQLAKQFSANEGKLAKLEEQLRLETGSLGELFGVVRQNAKNVQAEFSGSVMGIGSEAQQQVLDEIVAAKTLPTLPQLKAMWQAMDAHIQASGELQPFTLNVLNGNGEAQPQNVQRLGAMGLLGEQGYLNWDGAKQHATLYSKQPETITTSAIAAPIAQGEAVTAIVDPSRGILLDQLALTPTLEDRLAAGGVVGNIIIGLLAIGLLIGLVRGIMLSVTRAKISAQLKKPTEPGNNPLGRILSVYQKDKHRSVEALELRLLEAVVDEQNGLEKGLSMLKLLAALAPMLGLLGTVTGMIETFQVITQFGNGDPKVMAGGISMALVTTVLGLVAAMPLLLVHNILSGQAESIRNILEKQGIGMVAEQAERESTKPHLVENVA